MTTLHLKKSIGRSPWRVGYLLITLALAWFALSPTPNAFGVSPAPDGGYAGNNTAEGSQALFYLTSGIDNTGLGFQALYHNTTGNFNTAVGFRSIINNRTGGNNTAIGAQALFSNTAGSNNTALGVNTLYSNTTGVENTACGVSALYSNTIGIKNTATGNTALANNTTGVRNTADGEGALLGNTTGYHNTATGHQALAENTTGPNNTADGQLALQSNTIGDRNVAVGRAALQTNTEGAANTAIGTGALGSNTTGRNNIALGVSAGSNLTGSNNIDLGNVGVAAESNTIRIGTGGTQTATFIAGINLAAIAGNSVVVAANHRLGVATSSARFKNEIKPMNKASEAILTLKPVTFRYKKAIDPDGIPQFGLVAEEVEKVNPDLVVHDKDGKPYSVRYDAVNAMLLNEFLKEHRAFAKEQRQVEEQGRQAQNQEATIAHLKQDFQSKLAVQEKDFRATVAQLNARLEEQDSKIKQVSAQLEATKPAPQVVNNP